MGLIARLLGKARREGRQDTEPRGSEAEKQDMIKGVEELPGRTVKEVMVPRIDVVFVPEKIAIEELNEILVETGHSRFPVYKETIDNVTGILYVKDLLPYMVKKIPIDMTEIPRRAYFVPDTMKLDALLKEFRKRKVHIATSVDEYGGVSGIVCLEDIIEEIVGDIQDEFDDEGEEITQLQPGIYLCEARFSIEDLNDRIGSHIPSDNFDTLGGFVFDLFGRIPSHSEKASHEGIEFIIEEIKGHRIHKIRVVKRGSHDMADKS